MNIKNLLVGSVAALGVATSASAIPTVEFILQPGSEPGSFELLADVSEGDNFGLAFFGVELTGIATNKVEAPEALTSIGFAGFAGDESVPDAAQIFSSQSLTNPATLVRGIGQAPGSIPDVQPFPGNRNPDFGAPVLLATGTLSGDITEVEAVQIEANVFAEATGTSVLGSQEGNVETSLTIIPEPATVGLMGLGALAVLRRRTA